MNVVPFSMCELEGFDRYRLNTWLLIFLFSDDTKVQRGQQGFQSGEIGVYTVASSLYTAM